MSISKKKKKGLFYSRREEIINALSHALGIFLGIGAGTVFLVKCFEAHNNLAAFSIFLYIFGMCSSYGASTFYHSLKHHNPLRKRLRHWDHAAIYWHIAGNYSPIALVALISEGMWGYGLFGFIWASAIVGTVFSFKKMKTHSYLETVCYIVMGLSIVVAFKPLIDVVPMKVIYWIIGEGVCFITGAVFYSFHKLRYMHSVFHVFVLGGSLCHMMAIWYILEKML